MTVPGIWLIMLLPLKTTIWYLRRQQYPIISHIVQCLKFYRLKPNRGPEISKHSWTEDQRYHQFIIWNICLTAQISQSFHLLYWLIGEVFTWSRDLRCSRVCLLSWEHTGQSSSRSANSSKHWKYRSLRGKYHSICGNITRYPGHVTRYVGNMIQSMIEPTL
jgi:hypothetical protein